MKESTQILAKFYFCGVDPELYKTSKIIRIGAVFAKIHSIPHAYETHRLVATMDRVATMNESTKILATFVEQILNFMKHPKF